MKHYDIRKLTGRQLDMIWYGLDLLRDYVKGSPYREERFGSVKEIEDMMTRTLRSETEYDDTETTA